MEQLGQYQIPEGYRRKPNIDRILFYHTFDPRVQRDYISFLQTEREFEIKYRNQYTEFTEKYKGALPNDKDWAFSTYLYRAICDRKSSSSYEEALNDYWFLCKLKEDYYDLEKIKSFTESSRISPQISRSQTTPSDRSSTGSPLIGHPPNSTTFNSKPVVEPIIFGAPLTVYTPEYPKNENLAEQHNNSSKGYSPNSFESSIHTNPEPLPVSNVRESSVTNKPMMKVFPVYNTVDHRSLTAQNKHLRELLQTQTDEIMSLRNVDRENQDIVHNLKARLSSCTCDDNPASIDYTANTSSAELAQRFVNVYDNEYKIAIDTLTSRHQDKLTEDVALYSLMGVIKRCFNLCTSVAAEQIENMTSLMTDQIIHPCVTQHSNVERNISANDATKIHADAERLSSLFRKRHCTVTITNLQDKCNEDLDKSPDYKLHLKTPEVSVFIEKCLECLWLMSNQQPPMSLQWPEQGELFDTTLYKYYKGKGFNVNFPVWPAVLMYHKGHILCKGFAVPM